MKGKIYLIPVTLGDNNFKKVIPEEVIDIIKNIRFFVVEEIKTARRFLRMIDKNFPINDSTFYVLNEHSDGSDLEEIIKPAIDGNDMGVMSEAGLPCIADPGSIFVKYAHTKDLQISPLVGPSSIILALISSGFNGQNFTFNGYLPVKPEERAKKIKDLERLSKKGTTQIFMETPYRNQKMVDSILETCDDDTLLCIATDITLSTENIVTKKVSYWKKHIPDVKNRYVIYVI